MASTETRQSAIGEFLHYLLPATRKKVDKTASNFWRLLQGLGFVLDEARDTVLLARRRRFIKRLASDSELGANLIQNGDFSAWTSNNPDEWVVENEDLNNFFAEHVDGAWFASDNTMDVQARQVVGVTPGALYRLEIRAAITTGRVRFSLGDADSYEQEDTTDTTITRYFEAATNELEIVLAAWSGGASNLIFQEIKLQKVGCSKATHDYYESAERTSDLNRHAQDRGVFRLTGETNAALLTRLETLAFRNQFKGTAAGVRYVIEEFFGLQCDEVLEFYCDTRRWLHLNHIDLLTRGEPDRTHIFSESDQDAYDTRRSTRIYSVEDTETTQFYFWVRISNPDSVSYDEDLVRQAIHAVKPAHSRAVILFV